MFIRSLARAASALALASALPAQELVLELVVAGLEQPTSMAVPPEDPGQILVNEKGGRVRVVRDGVLLEAPFLDLSAQVDTYSEGGLLSLVLHPGYAANGRLFVTYVTTGLQLRLAEYAASEDSDVALPQEVAVLYEIPATGLGAHWGGGLAFLPDGSLLMSVGDHAHAAAAQDPLDARGSILRLHPDLPPPYVPADNPFYGQGVALDELYALGLRNPWRFSFDAETGLWIGDVGWAAREEIDLLPAGESAGGNYGWPCREGTKCTQQTACDCQDSDLIPPLIEYAHQDGEEYNCVIAGHVYRGAALPELSGRFVHGDWASTRIWSFLLEEGEVAGWTDHPLAVEGVLDRINAFGVDAAGELYVLDNGAHHGEGGGELFRIVSPCAAQESCQGLASSTGAAARLSFVGSTSLGQGDLALHVSDAVPAQFALFFYGPESIELPFGDGLRCVGAGDLELFRFLPPAALDASGSASYAIDLAAPPAGAGAGELTAGSTWYFQAWYRDPFVPGGSGFNLSGALALSFCP